jgi:hypothetical protein
VDPEVIALIALVDADAAQLIVAEELAAVAVAKSPQAQLTALNAWLGRTWVTQVGSVGNRMGQELASETLNELGFRLGELKLDQRKALREHTNRSLVLGLRQAYIEIGGVPDGHSRIRRTRLAPDIERTLAEAHRRALAQTEAARRLIESLRIKQELAFEDAASVVAVAGRAVRSNEATARWAVNRANNQGIDVVASQLEADTVWLAERDACVVCLAYSGRIAPFGAAFSPDLTFGKNKPSKPWPDGVLWYPPRHPHCRCSTRVVHGYTAEQEREFTDALQREARRSIVRGYSMPSESEGVRLDAADRLLQMGARLPASVEEYGRRAVWRGKFPSRDVPTGR